MPFHNRSGKSSIVILSLRQPSIHLVFENSIAICDTIERGFGYTVTTETQPNHILDFDLFSHENNMFVRTFSNRIWNRCMWYKWRWLPHGRWHAVNRRRYNSKKPNLFTHLFAKQSTEQPYSDEGSQKKRDAWGHLGGSMGAPAALSNFVFSNLVANSKSVFAAWHVRTKKVKAGFFTQRFIYARKNTHKRLA